MFKKRIPPDRPVTATRFIQNSAVFILNGGIWLLAGILLFAIDDHAATENPMVVAGITLAGLLQFAGGLGAVIGVKKRRMYAIPFGLLASATIWIVSVGTIISAAIQGFLANMVSPGSIILLFCLYCGVVVIATSLSGELRAYLSNDNKPEAI